MTRRILIIALYVAFALVVYVAHGPRPDINIDHIAYFRLANDIRASHPNHDYWQGLSATRTYGVLMAYLFDSTGDHIRSLKFMLAVMTVAYLMCAEFLFVRLAINRNTAVFFSLISAVNVSFGSVFWGVTDFSASLNRTIIVPPMLLMLGYYLTNFARNRRLVVYPALIYLSVLHLGAYYLLGLLAAMDGCRLVNAAFGQKRVFFVQLSAYVTAFVFVGAAYISIQRLNLNSTVLTMLIPRIEATKAPQLPAVARQEEEKNPAHRDSKAEAMLSSEEAWKLERFAQPWRNFPPPLATILVIGVSLLFIVPLSVTLYVLATHNGGWRPMDKPMLLMAGCVLICAYAPQIVLCTIHHWVPIYPINCEEVRTISFIYIPLIYFVLRGFEVCWLNRERSNRRILAVACVLLLFVQPITVVRLLPAEERERIVLDAKRMGILDERESQRNLFARQLLGLDKNGLGFYYCVIPTLDWLRAHTDATSRVLTNRNELYLLDAKVIGTSNGFLYTDIRSPLRVTWHDQVLELDDALAKHDLNRILALAHAAGAKYAVVPWPLAHAAFTDGNFSVIDVM